ncbi:uncharacterized protein LOC108285312 isoform X2 [Cebus imitator]|uniref:uncharacterized protein LOC108285312 isoform X2 n=1 Tax=Cebus imitator TaxID=2715852 RepID=UPI00189979E2|nr:uncharacterized protein LOC108285312 isoform X2 [Cebus imitator]
MGHSEGKQFSWHKVSSQGFPQARGPGEQTLFVACASCAVETHVVLGGPLCHPYGQGMWSSGIHCAVFTGRRVVLRYPLCHLHRRVCGPQGSAVPSSQAGCGPQGPLCHPHRLGVWSSEVHCAILTGWACGPQHPLCRPHGLGVWSSGVHCAILTGWACGPQSSTVLSSRAGCVVLRGPLCCPHGLGVWSSGVHCAIHMGWVCGPQGSTVPSSRAGHVVLSVYCAVLTGWACGPQRSTVPSFRVCLCLCFPKPRCPLHPAVLPASVSCWPSLLHGLLGVLLVDLWFWPHAGQPLSSSILPAYLSSLPDGDSPVRSPRASTSAWVPGCFP